MILVVVQASAGAERVLVPVVVVAAALTWRRSATRDNKAADRTLIPILILVWLIPEDLSLLLLLLSVTLLQSYWRQAML